LGAREQLDLHRPLAELRQLAEDELPRATASTGTQIGLTEGLELGAATEARLAGGLWLVTHRDSSASMS
jgi:hypothetical protein